MMRQYQHILSTALPRTSSCNSTEQFHPRSIVTTGGSGFHRLNKSFAKFLRSLLSIFTFPSMIPTWLSIPGQLSMLTGTLFGHRRGHVSLALQYDPRSQPVFLIELAVTTAALVKEMSTGQLRIVLECRKEQPQSRRRGMPPARLFGETEWKMYCKGRQCGYARSRECAKSDWHELSTVQSVSVGAGVIPVVDDGHKGSESEGELLYMRARFERVVGNRDSEALYMLNPDGNGGPELSIFFLRI